MKKKSAQKLHLGKIRIANLSVAIQQSVKGKAPTRPESVCICSWPTED